MFNAHSCVYCSICIQRGLRHCLSSTDGQCESLVRGMSNCSDSRAFFIPEVKDRIMLKTKNILTILLLCCYGVLSAQCPNFTDLTDTSVTCQYGNFSNPFQYTGIAVGRHTVITQQGADPRTGYQLPFLPPNENAVVKLGNEQTGAEAEAITYTFTVNPDSAILLLKFAVVFEDPRHPFPAQPRFVVRVLNTVGQLVEDCAEYDVTAAGDIPGFQSFVFGNRNVRWRPWTNVGIDLSDYAGQQIHLQFITYDCAYYGHYGYAYFTAACISNKLTLNGCDGNVVTLVAPDGFESYSWNNGNTSSLATYTVNGNTSANCIITSVTGCQFLLSGTFSANSEIPIVNSIVYDTICEGEPYSEHYFNLPEQWDIGTHTFRNTFFDAVNCIGGDVTTTLYLTVLPQYTHFYSAVCQGSDYDEHGFHYTNLQTGDFTDSIIFVRPNDCDSIIVLHMTVSPSFNLPNVISGESDVCCNEVYTYELANAYGLASFNWDVPNGVSILFGQGTASANIYFTDLAPNPATLSLTGTNGCGSGNIQLSVTHHPSYHTFFQDTLCTGNEYHNNGFDLARQDSTGWFTYINHNTTTNGCDSVNIIQLLVTNTPILTTLSDPPEICVGENTMVHALGENSGFSQETSMPVVAVGDILCTDNSIVKISDWPVEGKTAMGVVFYVDTSGIHGWAVHLQEISNGIAFGGLGADIASLSNFTNARDAQTDLNGYSNTLNIRNEGNPSTYPAAYSMDFTNGWYLPAIGQLRILYVSIPTLNYTLQVLNGNSIPATAGPWWFNNWWYLSSTEYSDSEVWVLRANGILNILNKNATSTDFTYYQTIGSTTYTYNHTANTLIRPIRNF